MSVHLYIPPHLFPYVHTYVYYMLIYECHEHVEVGAKYNRIEFNKIIYRKLHHHNVYGIRTTSN